MTNFSKKAGERFQPSASENKQEEFKRDESDNVLFAEWQVKDIRDVITDDCVAYYDADTLYYQASSNVETKFITVKHNTEGWEVELAGTKVFKGLGKGIKKDSWLYGKNLDRELEGKEPYILEDFTVTDGQRLKYDKEKALEQAKMQVYQKLKRLRNQFNLPKIVTVIGSGDPFRFSLPLCRPYKGNRVNTLRPLLLKELRQWGVEELGAVVTEESKLHGVIETDDRVDMLGFEGTLHYSKTGKFNKICILADKDGYNSSKLLINPDTYPKGHPKEGKFKYPQAIRVPNTSESAGDIEMLTKTNSTDYKFIGFKGIMWQMLTVDGADNYSALGHLNGGMGFGAESAYKVLKPCKTAKEALQATIDAFAEVLPYGVQYTTHTGEELDVPTLDYMNTYFRVVYMLRSMDDTMDFYKLCKAFKVDTSAIEDNNKLTPPVKTYVGDEYHLIELQELITSILKEDFKGLKAMKKADQGVVLDRIKDKLLGVDFESHYKWIQQEKEL